MPPAASLVPAAALLAALRALPAAADAYTYPVKSAGLASADAVQFYSRVSSGTAAVPDAHPVHGIQTADGGYIAVGKGVESEATGVPEAFAVKVTSSGAFAWAWRSNSPGQDAANAVAAVSAAEVVVVGYRTVGGVACRCITKLDVATGSEVWTTTSFGDAAGSHGAYEMVEVDGSDAYLSGVYQLAATGEMMFKSYGNVAGGRAIVQRIPLSALAAGTAPASSSITWSVALAPFLSAKAARVVGANVAVLLYAESSGRHASAALLRGSDGSVVWGPTDYGSAAGEGTDLQISADQQSFVIAGMGGSVGLSARLTSVAVADGARRWTQTYSAGGTPSLILNECWGGLALSDGYAMACGTGIEDCPSTLSATDLSNCRAGKGDLRPGAYPRRAGIWQSYIIRTDLAGALLWQRVDSYKEPGGPALGAQGWDPSSSASEWIASTADGGIVSINDEAEGVGILKLRGPAGSATTSPGASQPSTTPGGGATTSPSSVQPSTTPAGGGATTSPGGVQPSTTHDGGGSSTTSPGGAPPSMAPGGGGTTTISLGGAQPSAMPAGSSTSPGGVQSPAGAQPQTPSHRPTGYAGVSNGAIPAQAALAVAAVVYATLVLR